MKENPLSSHKGAATVQPAARRRTTGATLSTEDASGAFSQNDSSEDYDNDWDVGVGNLVIDLDADLAKTKWNNNNGSEGKSPSPASSPTKSSAKMSGVEHQATVDKGLKMKIKRTKNVGAKNDAKHEIVKEAKGSNSNNTVTDNAVNNSPMDKAKHSVAGEKEKGTKGRGVNKKAKERAAKQCSEPLANGGAFLMPAAAGGAPAPASQAGPCPQGTGGAGGMASSAILSVELDRISGPFSVKKDGGGPPSHDPYEFNAKLEDRPPSFLSKKVKVEKTETASSPIVPTMQDVGVETTSVGVATEPECLGPCEPGTSVTLEGIVWQETENGKTGMLVVNVTWRGKTYVGTLLDATKHDWGSPRFNCDSPTSDMEVQTPKGRAKRGRAAAQTPLNDMSNYGDRKLRKSRRCSAGNFQAPPSPARSDASTGVKRKGRPYDLDATNGDAPKASKRSRSNSRSTPTGNSDSSTYIECPEPNCNKKYKHINGLRYHQNHAHQSSSLTPEENNTDEPKEMESEDSSPQSPSTAAGKTEKPSGRGQSKSKKNNAAQASQVEDDSTPAPEAAPAVRPSPKKRGSGDSHNSGHDNKSGELKNKVIKEEPKEEKKPVVAPVVPSTSADTKASGASPQVFQISGAPMGCLNASTTVVSATPVVGTTTPAAVASPATHIATGTTVTVPVAVTSAGLMAVQDIKEEKPSKKGKGEKGDKSRGKGNVSSARPIMPAPTPQLAVAHTTLTTVTTHAQISPISPTTSQLKPIQPKPTIMGDPPAINPALQGLKDKKPKKKKSKDKDGQQQQHHQPVHPQQQPLPQQPPQQPHPQQQHVPVKAAATPAAVIIKEEHVKPESLSVIKTAPSPMKVFSEGDRTPVDLAKMPPELTKQPPPLHLGKDGKVDSPSKMDPSRLNRPPSSLSLHSPLQVSTDSRDQTGEVQSPAYSDISDANESAPTLENEVAPKPKEEEKPVSAEGKSGDRPPDHAMASSYGMYHPYYGQPPYLIPAVSQSSSQGSQGSSSSRSSTPKPTETPEGEKGDSAARKEQAEPQPGKPKDSDAKINGGFNAKVGSSQPPQADQHAARQRSLQQPQMYSMTPYQHLSTYGAYNLDPNYHMQLMASDPQYRQQHEKLLEEERCRQERVDRPKDSPVKPQVNDGEKGKPEPHRSSEKNDSHGAPSAKPRDRPADKPSPQSRPPALISEKERSAQASKIREAASEASLREKRDENHQILKENIELKHEMENRAKFERDREHSRDRDRENFEHRVILERQQRSELERFYMYQQQKLMEQQRIDEERRRYMAQHKMPLNVIGPTDLRKPPAETVSVPPRASPDKPPRDHSTGKMSGMEPPREGARSRDSSHSNDSRSRLESDSKMDKGKEGEDKRTTPGPSPRTTPKLKEVGPSPSSVPTSIAPASSYAQYFSHPYIQSPHYAAQMPFDPNHLYRGPAVVGYAPQPYLHPSQVRYHMSPVDVGDKDKPVLLSPGGPVGGPSEHPGKALELLQQHASHYYGSGGSSHKIHELKEVAKGDSKPSPSKGPENMSGSGDAQREASSKGREYVRSPPPQRHLHTHHHTHVVGPGLPLYDPMIHGAAIMASPQPGIPHPYGPK